MRLGSYRSSSALVSDSDLSVSDADRAVFRDLQYASQLQKEADPILQLICRSIYCGDYWWINVYAATSNQVVELGIGMFLTPLFTVALGVVFFRERLSRLKQLSVFLPFLGVLHHDLYARSDALDCIGRFFFMGALRCL